MDNFLNADYLKRFQLFEYIPYDTLLKVCIVKRYEKKEVIFREGEIGSNVHILINGIVRLYRSSPAGQQRTLMFVRPTEVFGNIPLVDKLEHTVTAEVFEPCIDLTIDNAYIREIIQKQPDLLWYLTIDLVKKLRITNQAIEEAYLTAEQRILRGMVLIARQFGHETHKGMELTLNFTQEDLARFTGTTRVTVANVISSLVEQGILKTKPKPWVIHNIEALYQLV